MVLPCSSLLPTHGTSGILQKRSLEGIQGRIDQTCRENFVVLKPESLGKSSRHWKILTRLTHWLLSKIQRIAVFLFAKNHHGQRSAASQQMTASQMNPYKPGEIIDPNAVTKLLVELHSEEKSLKSEVLNLDLGKIGKIDILNTLFESLSRVKSVAQDLLKIADPHGFRDELKKDLNELSEAITQSFQVLACKSERNSAHLESILTEKQMSSPKYQKCLVALGILKEKPKAQNLTFVDRIRNYFTERSPKPEKREQVPAEQRNGLPFIKWMENSCYLDVVLWMILANKDIFIQQMDSALYRQDGELVDAYKTRKKILLVLNHFFTAAATGDTGKIKEAREGVRKAIFDIGDAEFRKSEEGDQHDPQEFLRLIVDALNQQIKLTTIRQGQGVHSNLRKETPEIFQRILLIHFDFPEALREKDGSIDFKKLIEFRFAPHPNAPGEEWDHSHDIGKISYTEQTRLKIEGHPPPYLAFQIQRFGQENVNTWRMDTPISMGKRNQHFHMDFSSLATGDISESLDYELVASINHLGSSINSGHYTIDLKQDDGSWVRGDDMNMDQSLSKYEKFMVSKQSYILLFKHKSASSLHASDTEAETEENSGVEDIASSSSISSSHSQVNSPGRGSSPDRGDSPSPSLRSSSPGESPNDSPRPPDDSPRTERVGPSSSLQLVVSSAS